MFVAYAIHLYAYIKRILKYDQGEQDSDSLCFLQNYKAYILVITGLWTLVIIGLCFNEFLEDHSSERSWFFSYYVIVPISNTAKVLQSLVLNYYRLRQPYVQRAFK